MKKRNVKRLLQLLILCLFLCCKGVHGAWTYAQISANSYIGTASVVLDVFDFSPENVLPDEDAEGKSHVVLVDDLVNSENGLNNEDSYLNEQISARKKGSFFKPARDTLGSMGIDQKDELEELFSAGTKNLSFLIWFVSDTEYHIFTTEVDLGRNGNPIFPIGQAYISPIYRTIVIRENNVWVMQSSAKGYALSAYYEESNFISSSYSKIPSFDPETWSAGELTEKDE